MLFIDAFQIQINKKQYHINKKTYFLNQHFKNEENTNFMVRKMQN